jgi:hypothetical protein
MLTVQPHRSGGALLFHEWVTMKKNVNGVTNQHIADEFGWDASFITHLCAGTKRPSLVSGVKIQRRCGIAVEHWVLQQELT